MAPDGHPTGTLLAPYWHPTGTLLAPYGHPTGTLRAPYWHPTHYDKFIAKHPKLLRPGSLSCSAGAPLAVAPPQGRRWGGSMTWCCTCPQRCSPMNHRPSPSSSLRRGHGEWRARRTTKAPRPKQLWVLGDELVVV
eukprot:gene14593-biopygen21653